MKLVEDDLLLLALVNREIKGYVTSMDKARLRDGIRHILAISRHGNQYMQSQQPWVLFKGTDDQKARAGTITGILCNLGALLSLLVFPYMPEVARNMFDQLQSKHRYIDPEYVFEITLYFVFSLIVISSIFQPTVRCHSAPGWSQDWQTSSSLHKT